MYCRSYLIWTPVFDDANRTRPAPQQKQTANPTISRTNKPPHVQIMKYQTGASRVCAHSRQQLAPEASTTDVPDRPFNHRRRKHNPALGAVWLYRLILFLSSSSRDPFTDSNKEIPDRCKRKAPTAAGSWREKQTGGHACLVSSTAKLSSEGATLWCSEPKTFSPIVNDRLNSRSASGNLPFEARKKKGGASGQASLRATA